MSRLAIEFGQHDAGDKRANAQRFAGKADAERAADETTTAMRSDEISRPDAFFTLIRLMRKFADALK